MTGDSGGAPLTPIAFAPEGSPLRCTCNECEKAVGADDCYALSGYVMNSRATTRQYQSAAATITKETTTTYTDVLPYNYCVCFDCARIRCAAEREVSRVAWRKTLYLAIGLTTLGAAITGFIAFAGISGSVVVLVGLIAAMISAIALGIAGMSRRVMIIRNELSRGWAVRSYGGLIAAKMNRTTWMTPASYEALRMRMR